ncbi:porin [Pseudorhodoferax sp. Leaf274]|uniref:porin n=1 Tax=Pseudorhodoferax sp. Leaf274 TaxID=1736318 RepID=UPI000703198A|nr:porin [Pseudorhodoferax sp. Leaf274]KQP49143.1 hypothetical protein ASF44_00465 [Pseudorhodoferax sp. Leaf274]
MHKNLIALAAILCCSAASAQSSVTIYGILDAYVGSVKTPAANGEHLTQTVVRGGGIKHSRLGFKGTEDLGGGLKANFKLEGDFDAATGAMRPNNNYYTGETGSSLFNNATWVGFSGGFGEVRIGRAVSPFDDAKGIGAAGFNARIFAPAAFVWASNDYQAKPGNSVFYYTPTFSGLSGSVMYSLGENKTSTASAGKVASAMLSYVSGPAVAMLSYQTEQRRGDEPTARFFQFNGTYNLGFAKLLGAYGRLAGKSANIDKTQEYQLGVDVPVGGLLTLTAGYAWSKDDVLTGSGAKRDGLGVAALYYLSKRTSLYGGFNFSKREVAGAPDAKTRVIATGVRHTF